MSAVDALGYLAALLVLLTFCMRGMVALRVLAIASNVAFIVYAATLGLAPVLLLHGLLLPLNVWRMRELTRASPTGSAPDAPGPGCRPRCIARPCADISMAPMTGFRRAPRRWNHLQGDETRRRHLRPAPAGAARRSR